MTAPKTLDLFAPARRPTRTSLQPLAVRATRPSTERSSPVLWLSVHVPDMAAQESEHALRRLHALALRAQRFTPRVSLAPPDALLLEVRASLHLFGGAAALRGAMAQECAQLSMPVTMAFAPTPLAALVAARAGRSLTLLDATQLIGSLAPLPLTTLRWPREVNERLASIGVRSIGQALRLPRAGFAQRFGPARLADLDRLTGRAADPRERFETPARFRRRRELPCESTSHALLVAALWPLIEALGRFLAMRQCGVLALECRLLHRYAAPTRCVLRLSTPIADARRLAELLEERLRALRLPEPARACELRAGVPVARPDVSAGLWSPGERGGLSEASGGELIERLRARLGAQALETLALVPDHRPEMAWRAGPPAAGAAPIAPVAVRWSRRPLWLLPAPRRLSQRSGLPRWRGALRLEDEPERIETGWWDGHDVARDYYTALDAHGRRLWVFRERGSPHRWFLQGVYG